MINFATNPQNRLNLNILLRDHEYPAYFLIDYTFLGCIHICKLCLFRIGCEVISSILLYKHHVSLRILY